MKRRRATPCLGHRDRFGCCCCCTGTGFGSKHALDSAARCFCLFPEFVFVGRRLISCGCTCVRVCFHCVLFSTNARIEMRSTEHFTGLHPSARHPSTAATVAVLKLPFNTQTHTYTRDIAIHQNYSPPALAGSSASSQLWMLLWNNFHITPIPKRSFRRKKTPAIKRYHIQFLFGVGGGFLFNPLVPQDHIHSGQEKTPVQDVT